MLLRLLLLTSAAVVASASADAQPRAVFPTGDTSGDHTASGGWAVSPGGGQVNVHWLCPAFEHATVAGHQANLNVSLVAQSASGSVSTQVLQGSGSTDLSGGQSTTTVTAAAAGLGVANFQVTLQIDDTHCPQGSYQTTVDVTMTSP